MHKSKWVPLSIHETKQGPVGPSQGQSLLVPLAETSTRETKHPTWSAGELRFIMPAGPEELTLQALSPKQKGYRIFIHGQAWLSGFAGLQGPGDCKEQDKGEWDKLQFLVLWVPTFWDLHDPDFARSKLSYRGKRSRRLCKILPFPLQTLFLRKGSTSSS